MGFHAVCLAADRVGRASGTYLGVMLNGVAASFEARGLVATAAGGLTGVTTLVELLQNAVAPHQGVVATRLRPLWVGQKGLRYYFPRGIVDLVNAGYLREVKL